MPRLHLPSPSSGRLVRLLPRRLVVLATILGSLLLTTPVPFPRLPLDLRGGEFPCAGCGCGCRSAADCFSHCCCFSPSELLAWAREHGMRPTAALLARVETTAPTAPPVPPSPEDSACCSEEACGLDCGGACCTSEGCGERQVACCEAKAAADEPDRGHESEPAPREPAADTSWAHTLAAGRCQGFLSAWVGGHEIAPARPPSAWRPDPLCRTVSPLPEPVVARAFDAPPTPPG